MLYCSKNQANIEFKCLTQYSEFFNIEAIEDPPEDVVKEGSEIDYEDSYYSESDEEEFSNLK